MINHRMGEYDLQTVITKKHQRVGWGECNEPQHVRCLLRRLCWGLQPSANHLFVLER